MDAIDRLRRFNRRYTAHMGLLTRDYLGTGQSVTEVRVLYELAEGAGRTARDLVETLGLDEGYLSRILTRFAERGWVERQKVPGDARRRGLRLTAAGRAALAPLDAKSRADTVERIAPRTPTVLERAAEAADTLAGALGAVPDPVVLRDLEPGDAGWLIQQHGERYVRDEGFDASFEPLVAEILADFLKSHDPCVERGWIAARGPVRLGSIFCVRLDAETAKLRLFYTVPEARGQGVGRQLLDACIGFARAAGYLRLTLWTHESHRAACRLYAGYGFRMTDSVPVRSFGQDLVEQTWVLDL